ncbi:GlsB/YeaQ/YmgE family stress response membrane protein [Alcaligenes sp. SJTW-7]|uniref:GlsB/YeaQ/YmgE family stress response membrane protein n=1 Tax=Alcaligenes sp. SJTW-7 TaxID=3078429 RepID=UPI0039ECA36B
MGIISMIVVGFIVGLLARAIMPGDQKMGWIMTTILGIVGAFVAGYLGQAMGWYVPGEGAGWIGSIVGAIIVLFIYGLVSKKA